MNAAKIFETERKLSRFVLMKLWQLLKTLIEELVYPVSSDIRCPKVRFVTKQAALYTCLSTLEHDAWKRL